MGALHRALYRTAAICNLLSLVDSKDNQPVINGLGSVTLDSKSADIGSEARPILWADVAVDANACNSKRSVPVIQCCMATLSIANGPKEISESNRGCKPVASSEHPMSKCMNSTSTMVTSKSSVMGPSPTCSGISRRARSSIRPMVMYTSKALLFISRSVSPEKPASLTKPSAGNSGLAHRCIAASCFRLGISSWSSLSRFSRSPTIFKYFSQSLRACCNRVVVSFMSSRCTAFMSAMMSPSRFRIRRRPPSSCPS
mmetsp:Transcript_47795/g.107276  ORF Transcript_47795/g.107276 Transcript_47795/m.107276 type:complete len:256 (-) Transcript_47795:1321-2088(-)